MAKVDMSSEIELGVTGGEEDGVGVDIDESADNSKLYTQPEDVLQAYERLSPLGHFSVAASFGNVHGVYKPGNVKLRPEILKNSQALIVEKLGATSNPLNLVFHGGSGSEKEKITEAVGYGVFKMNIDTDTQFAYSAPIKKYVETNGRAFEHQIDPDDGTPYKKLYDPRNWTRDCEDNMAERLIEAFKDLGSYGKSIASRESRIRNAHFCSKTTGPFSSCSHSRHSKRDPRCPLISWTVTPRAPVYAPRLCFYFRSARASLFTQKNL